MAANPQIPQEDGNKPQIVPKNDPHRARRARWVMPGVLLGIVVLLGLLVAVIYYLPRTVEKTPPPTGAQVPVQPVPGELELSNLTLVPGPTDEAFNIDGRIMNTGPHAVTGILAAVILHDSHGNVVQDVRRPLLGMEVEVNDLVPDPFATNPIRTNQTRVFRISVDDVPRSWNHRLPDVKITDVTAEGE